MADEVPAAPAAPVPALTTQDIVDGFNARGINTPDALGALLDKAQALVTREVLKNQAAQVRVDQQQANAQAEASYQSLQAQIAQLDAALH